MNNKTWKDGVAWALKHRAMWIANSLGMLALVLSPVRFFDLQQPPMTVFWICLGLQCFMLTPLLVRMVVATPSQDRPLDMQMEHKIGGVFYAPFLEELLFRAPLLLVWRYYPIYIIPATTISSFIFAYLHQHQYGIRDMGMAVLWKTSISWLYAWSAIVSGGLLLPVLLHMLNNGAAYLVGTWHDRRVTKQWGEFLWQTE